MQIDRAKEPFQALLYSFYLFTFQGPYEFWKVIEIENIPFARTWKVLEKRGFFKMAKEKFWICVWKNSRSILK